MRLPSRPVTALIAVTAGLLCGLAGLIPVAGAAAAGQNTAAGPMVAVTATAAPRLPAGATRLGRLTAATVLHLDVTLKVRDQAGLTALLNGLADRNSRYFHQFLRPGQFGSLFGPTLSQVSAVRAALTTAGLSPGQPSRDRLDIPVTATAAQAERAFGIRIDAYRLPGGRVAYANTASPRLPASVAPLVTGVLGLNDLSQSTDGANAGGAARTGPAVTREPRVPAAAGPQPCTAATNAANAKGSFTTNQLALHYGLAPLYQLGDLGRGVRVAVMDERTYQASDLAAYESCYGIHTAVRAITVGAAPTTAGLPGTLFIEQFASLAPAAALDVYEAGTIADPEFEMLSRAVDADTDKVIVDLYYTCELAGVDVSLAQSEETLAEEADAQGQTFIANAGASGSTACVGISTADKAKLAVATLAALPYAIGVGGTTLSGDAPLAPETVFNEDIAGAGAGGGGLSVLWCMPAYQHKTAIPGLLSKYSKKKTSCQAGSSPYARQVPDISADADPFSGYVGYFQGAWSGGQGYDPGAEAVIAAVAAVIDASPYCADYAAGAAGLLPQALYKFVASQPFYIYRPSQNQEPEAFGDIVSGNNDYRLSGYTGGRYPATFGYDLATGLGYPLVSGLAGKNSGPIGHPASSTYFQGLAAGMCRTLGRHIGLPAVSKVTPDAGRAGKSITVTVHGKNFLPIPGADRAKVTLSPAKTYILAANCTSRTVCTLRLPALSARTVDVQIDAGDVSYSPDVRGDRFTYAPVPRVASISPGSGKPGTRVTVHGAGFVTVKGVYFGGRKGVAAKVVSSTEIIVFAPAGSGTVKVTVVTGGGRSNGATFKY